MTIPGDAGDTQETIRKGASGSYHTVVGIYVDSDTARAGIEQLHAHGFTKDEISLVVRESEAAAEIPSQAAAEKAGNSTGAGVALGGVGGGILAGLIGAGLLAIPVPGRSWQPGGLPRLPAAPRLGQQRGGSRRPSRSAYQKMSPKNMAGASSRAISWSWCWRTRERTRNARGAR